MVESYRKYPRSIARVFINFEIQSPAPGITVQEVHQLIQEQDQRFQAMMGQVMSHVMNMQSATQVSPPDQEMSSDGWSEFSAEDIQRLNAEARAELRETSKRNLFRIFKNLIYN